MTAASVGTAGAQTPQPRPSRVRHYVIAARDLDAICAQLYQHLGLQRAERAHPPGASPTEQFGFRTEMMRIGTTLIEVVSPIREPHQLHRFFEENGGDGGFMVVMQTYDDTALVARAAQHNLRLALEISDFRGQHLMQFDYRVFGTRFEFYRYTPEDNWWGDPLNGPYHDATLAEDIVGARVAVADPAAVAQTAAQTFLGTREGASVRFIDRRIDFVAPNNGSRGLKALYLTARDRSRAGTSARIANVEFNLV